MFHQTRAAALAAGLRRIDRKVDPDLLMRAAQEAGIALPIRSTPVYSSQFNGSQGGSIGYRIEDERLIELGAIVDRVIAKAGK